MPEKEITKVCKKCLCIKSNTEFYKRHSQCKNCYLFKCSVYKKTDAGKETQRRYRISDKGKESHKKYSKSFKGSIVRKRIRLKFNKSINGRIAIKRWRKIQYQRHKIHKYAREYVRFYVKSGKLPHPTKVKCKNCDNNGSHYHHTHGYERENWLKVVPLCFNCHKLIHAHH